MPLLLALYLLIVQAFAAAPSARPASVQRAHDVASLATGSLRDGDATREERSVRAEPAHGDVVAWVRQARPLAGVLATRGEETARRTPVDGATPGTMSIEAAFAASVRVRTLDDSHAVSARGALLPYFPTAPPLQG